VNKVTKYLAGRLFVRYRRQTLLDFLWSKSTDTLQSDEDDIFLSLFPSTLIFKNKSRTFDKFFLGFLFAKTFFRKQKPKGTLAHCDLKQVCCFIFAFLNRLRH